MSLATYYGRALFFQALTTEADRIMSCSGPRLDKSLFASEGFWLTADWTRYSKMFKTELYRGPEVMDEEG